LSKSEDETITQNDVNIPYFWLVLDEKGGPKELKTRGIIRLFDQFQIFKKCL